MVHMLAEVLLLRPHIVISNRQMRFICDLLTVFQDLFGRNNIIPKCRFEKERRKGDDWAAAGKWYNLHGLNCNQQSIWVPLLRAVPKKKGV